MKIAVDAMGGDYAPDPNIKGSIQAIIHQLLGGLRSCMGYTGCRTLQELHEKATFVQVTSAGIRESHVHDVSITKQAPNYQIES